MPTILPSLTEAISIAAAPASVLDLVGDPEQLPRWAPGFARAVRRDGEYWIVENAAGEQRVRVRVVRELGTVNFLAPNAERGAFARVVPNGAGSEMVFTLTLPAGASDEDVRAQREVVAAELATVRALVAGGELPA